MKITIAYNGISHLSLNYAAASAEKGFNIICYDQDINLINNLKKNKIEIFEPGLKKLLLKNKKKIIFTNDIKLLKTCNLVFIALDILTNNNGVSDLSNLKKTIKFTIKNIRKKSVLIIQSQLPPGFLSKINWNKKKLYYQVETLIFGKAVTRALSPERIIVGKNENNLDKLYKLYLDRFKCPKILMNYKSAELTKIFINIFLITQVTTTNVLSEYCENEGADWDKIKDAIMLDKRIGKHAYLKPGLGISGGNLERDLRTLIKFTNKKEYKSLFNSYSTISKIRKDWVLLKLKKFKFLQKYKKIGILGLSYKEGTNSIKNSPSINLIKKIKKLGFSNICSYDPKASYKEVTQFKNFDLVIKNSSIVIIMTPWESFKLINFKYINNVKIIIDPYKLITKNQFSKKQTYLSMGH
ncbi:nucleotide sugar dehydrogenase [Candidatus Pelagibacter giovannonii]|uniref:UDP-glucose 6-dehydrogenase n=1 Tax=Candidatus Pelagibacter giovannonii TaxID=2563896 RepID=A0A6H1Q1Z7_9PROT|nr:nucleotide sugar dehydrogenase [Candidatus Pelagibacter giovannonii]QIZ20848.1 nucleotide sugar dehydrogenase [Candidatus Pelagibacter giovannonii]